MEVRPSYRDMEDDTSQCPRYSRHAGRCSKSAGPLITFVVLGHEVSLLDCVTL